LLALKEYGTGLSIWDLTTKGLLGLYIRSSKF